MLGADDATTTRAPAWTPSRSGAAPLLAGPRLHPPGTPLRRLNLGLSPALQLALEHLNVSFVDDLDALTVGDLDGFGVQPAAVARLRGLLCGPAVPPAAATPEAGSPPLLGHAYPDWFLAMPVAALRLPDRLAEALSGAVLIGDLRGLTEAAILRRAGLNQGAVARLRDRLRLAYVRHSAKRAGKAGRGSDA